MVKNCGEQDIHIPSDYLLFRNGKYAFTAKILVATS